MSKVNKGLEARFRELEERLTGLNMKPVNSFSPEVIDEFFKGFYDTILGTLEFLRSNIKYYNTIQCEVESNNVPKFLVYDYESYQRLYSIINSISPKYRMVFNFKLSIGIWKNLNEIQEQLEVFFTKDDYSILYEHGDNQQKRFDKSYSTHLTPDEIRSLRDMISESIYNRISSQISK